LGAILYYESGDVPLLHGLGYHNRAAEQANLLLMCPAGEPFPHTGQVVVPGAWRRASLPAGRLAALAGAVAAGRCHFDKLTFRLEADQPVALTVADLRLSGPKGELLLDDFHSNRGWHGGRQQLAPGPDPRQQAMKAECHGGMTFIWRGGFDTTFSLWRLRPFPVFLEA